MTGVALFYPPCTGNETATGSLIEEFGRRETSARAEADRLRVRIEELSAELARAEEQAMRLVIAREEVTRECGESAVAEPSAGQDGRRAWDARPGSPIGAMTMLPWSAGPGGPVLLIVPGYLAVRRWQAAR